MDGASIIGGFWAQRLGRCGGIGLFAQSGATAGQPKVRDRRRMAGGRLRILAMACIGCLGVAGLSSPDARAACQVGTTPVAGIVNTYYPGVGSATAGSTTVTIGAMNANGASTAVQAGDRILIMQMQDATINSSNSISYGNGSTGRGSLSINNAGLYEYATVTAVSGSTLTLSAPLGNSYASASATATRGQRTFQVIRVPQYQTATLTGTVTAPAWNGATGGVVAIDALSMTFSGTIDVSGKGFRGGWRGVSGSGFASNVAQPPTVTAAAAASYNAVWVSNSATLPTTWSSTTANYSGGFKGEGIAGTPSRVGNGVGSTATVVTTGSFYPADPSAPYPPAPPPDLTGNMTIGAPGNAGGGGASVDASGGGGSNAGAGGQGGTWSGWMTPVGLGGAAYAGSLSAARLFMGGGGGGGASQNNSTLHGWPGTPGGGIVMLRTRTLSGGGTILASGQSVNVACGVSAGDGNGGTGAGGSVLVQAASSTGSLTIIARGGDQAQTGYGIYAGGGGGGAVYSTAAAAINVTGGTIPPNGANPQAAGCVNGSNNYTTLSQYGLLQQGGSVGSQSTAPLPPSAAVLCALPVDLFLTKTNTPGVNGESDQASDTVVSGEIRDYVITVSNLGPGAADGAAIKDPAVAGLTCTTASCTASGGASCPTQTGAALVTALQGATGALVPVLPANGRVVVTLTCQVQ